jgi:hypothetical protein
LRKTEDEVPGWYGPLLNHGRLWDVSIGNFSFKQYMIGFCGKIYPLITCETLFLEGEQHKDNYEKKFEEKKSPIFVCKSTIRWKRTIQWNACLKDYQFYQVFDTYMAYQEISMFLGSLAMPEKPIPTLDDKTMAESKGFNKWSFRKEPTKKR